MSNSFVQVPPDSTGKKVDTAEVVVGGQTVERQRIVVSDPSALNPDVRPTATGALPVDGSGVTQPVSGIVAVSNLPGTQPVSGTVAVSNFPATQPISGTVAVSGTVTVDASGHTVPVSGTFFQATQPISGTVTANVGTTNGLALDATVSATQPRDVTDRSGRLLGHVTVDSGSVSVSNFPATQPVSAVSLPLPSNAAQEAGGNLSAIYGILLNQSKIVDLLERLVAVVEANHLLMVSNSTDVVTTDDIITSLQ